MNKKTLLNTMAEANEFVKGIFSCRFRCKVENLTIYLSLSRFYHQMKTKKIFLTNCLY